MFGVAVDQLYVSDRPAVERAVFFVDFYPARVCYDAYIVLSLYECEILFFGRFAQLHHALAHHDLLFCDDLSGALVGVGERDVAILCRVDRAVSQLKLLCLARRDHAVDLPLFERLSVDGILPAYVKIGRVGEAVGVGQRVSVGRHIRRADGAVHRLHQPRAGVRFSVREEQSVHTEIAVVVVFAVVAAVGIGAVGVLDRVVAPLPNAAAHRAVAAIDRLPIAFERTGTDAHRVRIFAHKVGFGIKSRGGVAVSIFVDELGRRIHLRDDVIGEPRRAHNSLVVHGYGRKLFEARIAVVLIAPAARLVAERPHHDAGIVLVALVHTLHSVPIKLLPCGMVADRVGGVAIFTRARAVCLDVRLVDDVKTEIVGDLEEHRVGRIVRSAHRVDVVLLHQHRVFEIVERAHHIALALVCVVVVDALELDLAPVEEEDVALDRDLAKADLLTYALDDL